MKFRRKPIDRTVIDAIKLEDEYVWRDDDGTVHRMAHEQFEELYQPAHASPAAKPKRERKKRGGGKDAQPAAQQ